MTEYLALTAAHDDLTGIEGAESLLRLRVAPGALADLKGIERMQSLDTLHIEGCGALDLARLTALSALRILVIAEPRAPLDFRPLGALTTLVSLVLSVDDEASARSAAAIDCSGMRQLIDLSLVTTVGRPSIAAELLPRHALRYLQLRGFSLDAAGVDVLCGVPTLEKAGLNALAPSLLRRLADRRPDVLVLDHDDGGLPRLGEIVAHDDGAFSVALDLAGPGWGETNPEAELSFRDALERDDPQLARAVRFDMESSAVWCEASSRQALETLLAWHERHR